MIRLILLSLVVTGLALYAWRDWYKSLCGLILLMAVIEHPDMPKTIFDIQGLNPWNILLAVIVAAWLMARRHEGLTWDMPRTVNILLVAYLGVILVGFLRMITDLDGMIDFSILFGSGAPTTADLVSEHLINCVKWVIPGLLLYDGCRSRERFYLGLAATLGVYFLLSLQVIRWMPLENIASGADLTARSLKILVNEIGFHRVNLSMMLAGASWAVVACQYLFENRNYKRVVFCAGLVILFAQALTGGRMGYVTWIVVGGFLSILRWRKYLMIGPVVIVLIVLLVPGVYERMTQGFSGETRDYSTPSTGYDIGEGEPDIYEITAGRNIAWPYVLDKIVENPMVGYGTMAMQRTGLASLLMRQHNENFPHPHNAYLQIVLDNGLIGALPVLLFYLLMARYSITLFMDERSAMFITIGGVCLALVGALMVGSFGSQTFYPREGAVGMWCAIGLMLRAYQQRMEIESEEDQPDPANVWILER